MERISKLSLKKAQTRWDNMIKEQENRRLYEKDCRMCVNTGICPRCSSSHFKRTYKRWKNRYIDRCPHCGFKRVLGCGDEG